MVTAAVSGSPTSINGDFHVSYSPVKHGSVMLNYYRSRSSFEDNNNFFVVPSYPQTAKGQLIEGALGTYTQIGFFTGSLYAGWGLGQMRNDYGIERIADLRMNRFFVQPTFSFKNNWLRLGMGLKLVRLNFTSGEIDYRIEPEDIQVIQRLENEPPFWFPELGGNVGIHFKPVTVSANLVFVASTVAADFGFDLSNIGLGVTFELQEMFRKK